MEEIEIVRVAMQGGEMVFRVGKDALKDVLKFAKWLLLLLPNARQWYEQQSDQRMRHKINKEEYREIKRLNRELQAGAVPLDKFIQRYHQEERTILNIPESCMGEFSKNAKGKGRGKKGLSYAVLPDLNLADGMFQVMVPNSQLDVARSLLEHLTSIREKEQESQIAAAQREYDLAEQKEKEASALKSHAGRTGLPVSAPEDYQELCRKQEEAAKEKLQAELSLQKVRGMLPAEMSIEEYMATNPLVFNHADIANELVKEEIPISETMTVRTFLDNPQAGEACLQSPDTVLSLIKEMEGGNAVFKLRDGKEEIGRLKITNLTTDKVLDRFAQEISKKEREYGSVASGKEWFLCDKKDSKKAGEIIKKKKEQQQDVNVSAMKELEPVKNQLTAEEMNKSEYVSIPPEMVTKQYDQQGNHTGYNLRLEEDEISIPGENSIGIAPNGDCKLHLKEREYQIYEGGKILDQLIAQQETKERIQKAKTGSMGQQPAGMPNLSKNLRQPAEHMPKKER